MLCLGDSIRHDHPVMQPYLTAIEQAQSLSELVIALRPEVQPGDELLLKIVRQGKENNQGVGYLDDGTMVVVEDAAAQMQGVFTAMGQAMPLLLEDMGDEMPELPAAFFELMMAMGEVDPEAVADAYRDAYAVSTLTVSGRGVHIATLGP